MLDEEEYSKLMGLYDEIRTGRLQLLPFYPDPRMFVVDADEHMTGYRAKHVKAFLDGWMGATFTIGRVPRSPLHHSYGCLE